MINIIKQKCPNCGAMMDYLFCKHDRPGEINACEKCAEPPKTLQQINKERELRHNTKDK